MRNTVRLMGNFKKYKEHRVIMLRNKAKLGKIMKLK